MSTPESLLLEFLPPREDPYVDEDTSESFSSVSGGAGVLAGGGGGGGCREWRIDMSHIARR